MIKYLKIILVIIMGLLLGMIIHGLIEIPAIWILTTWLKDFFVAVSWSVWLWIHLIFTIITIVLGIALAFQIYRKYWK